MRCSWAKRALFLADRVAIVNQAFNGPSLRQTALIMASRRVCEALDSAQLRSRDGRFCGDPPYRNLASLAEECGRRRREAIKRAFTIRYHYEHDQLTIGL